MKHQVTSRLKKREEDNEGVKEQQRKDQDASSIKRSGEDNEGVKEQQRKRQDASRTKRRAHDKVKVKRAQVKHSRLCLNKKRLENPEIVKADQNERQLRHRDVKNTSDRLKEFREATKHNAVFICTCCQQRMFHSNVQLYTNKLKHEINSMKPGHTQTCVEKEITTCLDGEKKTYICKTCVRHMRKKKLPPMSAMN